MAVRVRVKNFQSIKDAEVVIDGFVVITGPNNSGKTAFLRALRGTFTNAPAGPLLRKGTNFLSVEITFDDGTCILWEKGWEKPNQKGKSINRYTLNGHRLDGVGRGVPPEIEALGVRQVSAASDRIWPQIADQFDGTLFLVNRPGSSVAEALSDVSRVGKLTSALRLSEKDRRSVNSELKVRRKDVIQLKDELAIFDGLEGLEEGFSDLCARRQSVLEQKIQLREALDLKARLEGAQGALNQLAGFDPSVLPSSKDAEALQEQQATLKDMRSLRDRLDKAQGDVAVLQDFQVEIPDPTQAQRIQAALVNCRSLSQRFEAAQVEVAALTGFQATLPTPEKANKLAEELKDLRALAALVAQAQKEVDFQEGLLRAKKIEADEAAAQVQVLLGERGLCPICGTVCQGHEVAV